MAQREGRGWGGEGRGRVALSVRPGRRGGGRGGAGVDTKIGRKEAEEVQDVNLGGLSIQKQHAVVRNEGGVLTLRCFAGAKTSVNGIAVESSAPLAHRDRIIFGNNHVFRVQIPAVLATIAAAIAAAASDGAPPPPAEEPITYEFAMNEVRAPAAAAAHWG